MSTEGAKSALLRAAIRCLLAEYAEEGSPDAAADAEYADERLAVAARDLVSAVDALPADRQPEGWSA